VVLFGYILFDLKVSEGISCQHIKGVRFFSYLKVFINVSFLIWKWWKLVFTVSSIKIEKLWIQKYCIVNELLNVIIVCICSKLLICLDKSFFNPLISRDSLKMLILFNCESVILLFVVPFHVILYFFMDCL
jgi:hypothetical protein